MVHGGGRRGGGGYRGRSSRGTYGGVGSRSLFHRRRQHVRLGGGCQATAEGGSMAPGRLDPVFARRLQLVPIVTFLTIVTWVILLVGSDQRGRERWTLNGGESRQVVPGFLSRSVEVWASSSRSGVGASLYAIPGKNCPPLTGPKLSFSDQHSMTLGQQDYQYDYFFLNAGSTVTASLSQRAGESEVLLLQGKPTRELMRGRVSNKDWDRYRREALASWSQLGREPESIRYQAQHSDTYMLVYGNNDQTSMAELTVGYTLNLTTYNLREYTPVCADLVSSKNGCRPIETNSVGCILVATSPNSKGGGEIKLSIMESRNWFLMFALTTVPAWLLVIWEVYRSRKEPQGWHLVGTEEEDNDGLEVIQNETIRIPDGSAPATHQPAPSAPMEDEANIPVAQAEVFHQNSLSRNASEAASAPIVIPTDQIQLVGSLQ